MKKEIDSLDLDQHIGTVALSNGKALFIPKLSMRKLIKVVKFLGIDGAKLYAKFQGIIADSDMDDMEKFVTVLESLEEEQLIHLLSILLDMSDEEALNLDLNEMLEVMVVYSEKLNLNKTFLSCRTLAKNLLGKELPETLGEWLQQLAGNMKPQMKPEEMGTETKKKAAAGALS